MTASLTQSHRLHDEQCVTLRKISKEFALFLKSEHQKHQKSLECTWLHFWACTEWPSSALGCKREMKGRKKNYSRSVWVETRIHCNWFNRYLSWSSCRSLFRTTTESVKEKMVRDWTNGSISESKGEGRTERYKEHKSVQEKNDCKKIGERNYKRNKDKNIVHLRIKDCEANKAVGVRKLQRKQWSLDST